MSSRVVYTRQRRLSVTCMRLCSLYSCTLPEDSSKRRRVHSTSSNLHVALQAFIDIQCELKTESIVPHADQGATTKWTVRLSCVLFPAGSSLGYQPLRTHWYPRLGWEWNVAHLLCRVFCWLSNSASMAKVLVANHCTCLMTTCTPLALSKFL